MSKKMLGTHLVVACKRGDLNKVKELLQNEIQYKDRVLNEMYEESMHRNHINITEYLIKNFPIFKEKWKELFEQALFWKKEILFKFLLNNKDIIDQVVKDIKKDPSIVIDISNRCKEELKKNLEIQHLLKSDEYGLFESNILNYINWKKHFNLWKN